MERQICAMPGCDETADSRPYSYSRYREVKGPPAGHGLIYSGIYCPEHTAQGKRMKKLFGRAGIGHPAGSVLLNLDKREDNAAEFG